jgi:hypothetical protein
VNFERLLDLAKSAQCVVLVRRDAIQDRRPQKLVERLRVPVALT